MHLSEPPSFLNVHPLCQYTHFVYLFICQWTLGELTPLVVVNSAAMNRHGVHHFILNGTSPFASFSGPDPWKVACEVVCSGMHQLLQVLQCQFLSVRLNLNPDPFYIGWFHKWEKDNVKLNWSCSLMCGPPWAYTRPIQRTLDPQGKAC